MLYLNLMDFAGGCRAGTSAAMPVSRAPPATRTAPPQCDTLTATMWYTRRHASRGRSEPIWSTPAAKSKFKIQNSKFIIHTPGAELRRGRRSAMNVLRQKHSMYFNLLYYAYYTPRVVIMPLSLVWGSSLSSRCLPIHHFKYKIHHFKYKIHRFSCTFSV